MPSYGALVRFTTTTKGEPVSEHPLLRAMAENEAYERAERRQSPAKTNHYHNAAKRSQQADVELARFREGDGPCSST